MNHCYRRVVTGEDKSGNSCVLSDGPVGENFGLPEVLDVYTFWDSDGDRRIPFRKTDLESGQNGSGELLPGPGGTKFVVEVAWPDKEDYSHDDAKEMFKSLNSERAHMEGHAAHPGMHRTDTIDYLVILSGEIYMLLETEEVLLKSGDTVVQSGVAHSWSNRSAEPCVILAVIVDADRQS